MQRVIDQLGGPVAIARLCGVSAPSATNWRKTGVPIKRCVAIEKANQKGIKRWHLRPDDWHEIWPELMRADGAPPVSAPAAASTVGEQHQEASHAA